MTNPAALRAILVVSLVPVLLPGLMSAQDMNPPQLTAFTFSPTSIDTSAGSANVTVNFTVTDDSSGATYVELTFVDPFGNPLQRASSLLTPSLSASSSVTLTFPRFSSAGTWTVGTVFGADVAGNTTILDTTGLQSAGFPTTLNVTSATDTTPPNLTGLSLSSNSIDTTTGPANLAVNFNATDDLAGVNALQVLFQSPSGTVVQTGNVNVTPGTTVSGSVPLTFPKFSEAGSWTLQSALLTDAAGNVQTLDSSALISKGFPTSVTVASTTDTAPPTLTALTFTPSTADVGSADVVITLTFHVGDNSSGAVAFQAGFSSPSGATTQNASATFPANTSVDGTATVRIPKSSETGTWSLTSVFLADAAGNTKVLNASDLAGSGFSTQLSITSDGASSGPAIVPTVTPAPGPGGWNTTVPVTVTWSVTDPAGVASSTGCTTTSTSTETSGLTLTCSATNGAGLTNSASVTLQIDTTPPLIVPNLVPPANASGWNNTAVNVTWDVSDPISNVASRTGCEPTSISTPTTGTVLNCSAINGAGLSMATSTTLKVDLTPPVIVPSVSGLLGANGWYIGDATVTWSVADADSGIASSTGCSAVVLSTYTPGTTLSCSATNVAGLTSASSVTIKVDEARIHTLSPAAASSFSASGTSTIKTTGEIVVNSSSSTAMVVSGTVKVTAKSVQIVGGFTAPSGAITPAPVTGVVSRPDPLATLVAPSYSGCNFTNFTLSGVSSATLSPGVYCGGITISGAAHATFSAGTYILNGGGLTVSGSSTLTGSGVTFYNTSNGFTYKPISLSGAISSNLSAPTSGPLNGILFFQDRQITSDSANTISGATQSKFTGTLYFPTTSLVFSGAGGSSGSGPVVIIANTLTVSGSTDLL